MPQLQPQPRTPLTILLVDDDADDCLMMQEAFTESQVSGTLHVVENGEALLDYLYQRGPYSMASRAPRPDLILLDLQMPGRDGFEILAEIRRESRLRCLPIVVLTTSKAVENVARAYGLGANSYIVKPQRFAALVDAIRLLGAYWGHLVELPPG